MSIKADVDKLISYSIAAGKLVAHAKIGCTEVYARRIFGLKKADPLIYREVELICEKKSRRARKKDIQEAARLEREAQTDAFR